jgi:hypothetical protein
MAHDGINHKTIRELDEQGVPRPDGTAYGNLAHALALFTDSPDDDLVLMATSGIYGERTGLTYGDLRALKEEIDLLHSIARLP